MYFPIRKSCARRGSASHCNKAGLRGLAGLLFVKENPEIAALGMALILFFAWFFYRSWAAVPFLLPLLLPFCRKMSGRKKEKRRTELAGEFREALGSMITAFRAGYSAENVIRETRREMALLYGEESLIAQEFYLMIQELDAGIPVEKLMLDFGERSGIEDIREFSQTFAIARRSGGSMVEIMGRTISLLQDRMEVEKEIAVLIAARKMEQKIMDGVPFLIVLYVGSTSEGFFAPLYHNAAGIAVMSVCLLVYLCAYSISERIVSIRM
ncbi:type II secretion system F family protein [Lachnoclostridium sp. Marseille-P6806]|uniref:type II secretion system F family protein n=1 Tax=Lachnoclostridium sp. Marseille-P6806 TaxID=2364793 RepID=UPI0013EF13E8|nr:type II secretion system F family protein [Lachnoclostridium sp. Marseille-P6806]